MFPHLIKNNKMVFEWPKGLHNIEKIPFENILEHEYSYRAMFLHLSLSIERIINNIISSSITTTNYAKMFSEDIILQKISLENKEDILKEILMNRLIGQGNKIILETKKKARKIEQAPFLINFNKFFAQIEIIRKVRNHVAHSSRDMITIENIVLYPNPNYHPNKRDIIFRDQFLIKGHFVLWLLETFSEYKSLLNMDVLKQYYIKNKEVLKEIAELR